MTRTNPQHVLDALALVGKPREPKPHSVVSAADATRPDGVSRATHRQAVYRAWRKLRNAEMALQADYEGRN